MRIRTLGTVSPEGKRGGKEWLGREDLSMRFWGDEDGNICWIGGKFALDRRKKSTLWNCVWLIAMDSSRTILICFSYLSFKHSWDH